MNKLIILTGPSATGKTTLGNFILENNIHLEKVHTCTTRPKRSQDDDYIFLSLEQFTEKISNKEFVEWEEVYPGCFYGLLHSELEDKWKKESIPLLVLDIKGANKLKKQFKDDCLVFFISSNKEELTNRLIKRGNDKNINERLNKMNLELSFANSFDYNIKNEEIFDTYKEINNKITDFVSADKKFKTLIVSLYGGPGTGKSTLTAAIFSQLKFKNINCEMVTEYAKDKIWEKSFNVLLNQIYIFGKQHHRIFRLLGQVDVIITDAPVLLQLSYSNNKLMNEVIIAEYNKMNNIDIMLKRVKEYNPKGRTQNEEQAIEKDNEIRQVVEKHAIGYYNFVAEEQSVQPIVELILDKIKQIKL